MSTYNMTMYTDRINTVERLQKAQKESVSNSWTILYFALHNLI